MCVCVLWTIITGSEFILPQYKIHKAYTLKIPSIAFGWCCNIFYIYFYFYFSFRVILYIYICMYMLYNIFIRYGIDIYSTLVQSINTSHHNTLVTSKYTTIFMAFYPILDMCASTISYVTIQYDYTQHINKKQYRYTQIPIVTLLCLLSIKHYFTFSFSYYMFTSHRIV